MQHSEAIEMMAAEKYVLKDLTPELRDTFEEHFFDCQECALDVRLADAFVEHSKLVLGVVSEEQTAKRVNPVREGWITRLWRPALAVPVMAALLLVIGYQQLVSYPKLKHEIAKSGAMQVLPSLYLTSGTLMGSGNERVVTTRPDQPFLLMVDIRGEEQFASYICELYSPTGALEGTFQVPAEAAKNSVPVQVPAKARNSGTYKLVVRGIVSGTAGQQQATEIESLPFKLQVQQ